jgi:hypothetical protein
LHHGGARFLVLVFAMITWALVILGTLDPFLDDIPFILEDSADRDEVGEADEADQPVARPKIVRLREVHGECKDGSILCIFSLCDAKTNKKVQRLVRVRSLAVLHPYWRIDCGWAVGKCVEIGDDIFAVSWDGLPERFPYLFIGTQKDAVAQGVAFGSTQRKDRFIVK